MQSSSGAPSSSRRGSHAPLPPTGPNMLHDEQHAHIDDGINHPTHHHAHSNVGGGFMSEFEMPYTPSGFLEPLGGGGGVAVKNDLTFGHSLDPQQAATSAAMHHAQQVAPSTTSFATHPSASMMIDEQASQFAHDLSMPIDSSISPSAAQLQQQQQQQQQQYMDSAFSKSGGVGTIGHLGTMPHTMDPAAIYNGNYQQPIKVKAEQPFDQVLPPQNQQQQQQAAAANSLYATRNQAQQQAQGQHSHQQSATASRSRHINSQSSSSDMDFANDVSEYVPGAYYSGRHSIASESSAASTPDVHLQGMTSGQSSDRSSAHTSPLVSTPDGQPETPMPLHTQSPIPLPNSPPLRHNTRNGSTTRASSHTVSSLAGEPIHANGNNGLISTLQSATDVLLSVNLFAGNGKKKTWPTRVVSLQSLHNPALTYAQLLFHVANISTFLTVHVEGKEVLNAQPQAEQAQAPGASGGHVVTLQDGPLLKSRLEQLRHYAHQTGSREHSNSSDDQSHRSTLRSRRSTPTSAITSAAGGLEFPPLEITFQLAENVKNCTRLGCLNLLVNKANRRACNICQSHGAEINPSLLRRLVINPHQSATQYAYLEQILEDYEYWKFDSLDDHSLTSASSSAAASGGAHGGGGGGGHTFPFVNQIGYYIAFIDAHTAAHVQKDFNHKMGAAGAAGQAAGNNGFISLNSGAQAAAGSPIATAICEVDLNYAYAIKMKSHFWMLEVKPKASVVGGSSTTRLKSKFYKKVGKPNQSRATAAAAAMVAQQAAAAQAAAAHQANGFNQLVAPFGNGLKSEDFGGGDLLGFNRGQQHKRRFDDPDGPVANMLAVNHLNINMPPNAAAAAALAAASAQGGAPVDLIVDGPDAPSNTVHVSDSTFRVMKNQPVSAMMSVHDTSADASAPSGASGAANGETVDSKPLVGNPTPVVLVYRDMEAYQRDILLNGSLSAGAGGMGGGADLGGSPNAFNGNLDPTGSNKRGRFDNAAANSGNAAGNNNGNNMANSFSMATVATPVVGMVGNAMPSLNAAASMAGVAAAMNQFQLAQVAQAQMQQQLFQQVAMDYGRFPAPWVFQDRAAPAEDVLVARPAGGMVELAHMGTKPLDEAEREVEVEAAHHPVQEVEASRLSELVNESLPFEDEEKVDMEDGSTFYESQSGHPDLYDSEDDGPRVRMHIAPELEEMDLAAKEAYGRVKTRGLKGAFSQRDAEVLLLEDDSPAAGVKAVKPPVGSGPVEAAMKYRAFEGRGPASEFLRSFHFFQQSFWGMLSTLLLGLVALIILVSNMHSSSEDEGLHLGLLNWNTPTIATTATTSATSTAAKYAVPSSAGGDATVDPSLHAHAHASAADELVALALGAGAVPVSTRSKVDLGVSSGNSTDSSDPVIQSRRLYASTALFSSMRDASSVFNNWALTSPVVVANMLNPPPGSPATVNVDVITTNCNSGVRIGRGIGDYLLSSNGLLAAFSFLASPPTMPVTATASDLCQQLTTGIGSMYMYQLTCVQWIAGNRLSLAMPASLSCSSAGMFDLTFNAAVCTQLLATIKQRNLTNVYFTPYNTTLSVGASPTVYYEDVATTDVPQTVLPASSSSTVNATTTSSIASPIADPLTPDALDTLRALPHLAAISFYTQASDLRSLCVNFGVINTVIAGTTSSTTSTSSTATDSTSTSTLAAVTTSLRHYNANGYLFGLVALGSLGLFFILQMIIFAVACLGKVVARRLLDHFRPRVTPPPQQQVDDDSDDNQKQSIKVMVSPQV